jgi:GxxExxY protein
MNAEELSALVVDAAYHIHLDLGPGLLESVYQNVLTAVLKKKGLKVETEVPVAFDYEGMHFASLLRADIIVDGQLIVELKSVEQTVPVFSKQLLTYLRLLKMPLGLLINFGSTLFRDGCHRVVNGPIDKSHSRLQVNQPSVS